MLFFNRIHLQTNKQRNGEFTYKRILVALLATQIVARKDSRVLM
jgi:hypothetical protein